MAPRRVQTGQVQGFLDRDRACARTAPWLGGVVEDDELVLRRCVTGQQEVRAVAGRPPRRHGGTTWPDGSPRGLGRDRVALLTARARGGRAPDAVLEWVGGETIAAALGPVLAADAELCTDGAKAYVPLARARNLVHHWLVGRRRRVRGIFHIQHVNGDHGRLARWLARFQGVGTAYPGAYPAWHLFVDGARGPGPVAAADTLLVRAVALPPTGLCAGCGRPLP